MSMLTKLYNYLDYREFLKDYYHELKEQDKKFSQRYIALKLGVKSSGFLSEIFNGKRNLSQKNILQWFAVLKLDKDQCCYFENLVHFNQSGTLSEKSYWLQKLMECKKVNLTLLNKDIYEYFSKWYYSAIRELLFFYKEPIDAKKIAVMLNPPIKPEDVKTAVALLERLNMIEKATDGSYRQKESILSTGDQVKSVEVANFQLQTIELAKNAVSNIASYNRDISTLTLSISGDGFEKICSILRKTRKDILSVAQNDNRENRVCQVNIQLFPLTKI